MTLHYEILDSMNLYDRAVSRQKDYWKMVQTLIEFIISNRVESIFEVGVGTGLYTQEIIKTNPQRYRGIDIDEDFLKLATRRLKNSDILRGDGVIFKNSMFLADMVTMTLVYHHIDTKNKVRFLGNCHENLANGGVLAIGDVFLPHYNNEFEWKTSLQLFHNNRIRKMTERDELLLEKKAFVDGLRKEGEWKTCVSELIEQINIVGFRKTEIFEISKDVEFGGYFVVYAFK